MSENNFSLQGGKIPVYNHYQLNVAELHKQRPDIQLSVLRFSGEEALDKRQYIPYRQFRQKGGMLA